MGERLQVASIDGPGSDVALEDGFLLDTAHLGDGLPVVSIHFGVDLDTLDWRVVNATQVGGAQQRKPVCVCVVCVCVCVCGKGQIYSPLFTECNGNPSNLIIQQTKLLNISLK